MRGQNEWLILISGPAGKKIPTATKTTKKVQKTQKNDDSSKEATGLSNLKISDAPPPKSKGLDVVKEFEQSSSKKSSSFVVVGMLSRHRNIV